MTFSPPPPPLDHDHQVIRDRFARFLRGRGGGTARNHGQYLRYVEHYLRATPDPWDATTDSVDTWVRSHQWSPETTRKAIVSLRAFYRWALTEGEIERTPVEDSRIAARRGPAPVPVPDAWAKELGAFARYGLARGRSDATVGTQQAHLRPLARTYPSPWDVSTDDLTEFLAARQWKPETRRGVPTSIRAFYKWGIRTGRTEDSPSDILDGVRIPRALPRPAPDDAIRTALERADDRVRLALLLAAYAGLRRMEIAKLHVSDIRGDSLSIVGKGDEHRVVPIHPDLQVALADELARRRSGGCGTGWRPWQVRADGYLFPSDKGDGPVTPRWIGTLMARALPDGFTAHQLRHRFATSAYLVERDLRAVQELLGHSKPETTARYAAVPDGALRAAVAGVGL